ncbi:MAG: NlpC/P60 family protein [Endomicrobia bacterium]|nr:NlpC/P60 family protein [Endomicrobiia bacterium]
MKKTAVIALAALCFFSCFAYAKKPPSSKKKHNNNVNIDAKETAICPAPTAFQDVNRMMKSPGYWISKLKDPDKVILTLKEIEAVNAKTGGQSIYLTDIQYFQSIFYRRTAAANHTKMLNMFSKYYDGNSDKPVGRDHFTELDKNISYNAFASTVNVRFAMTVSYAELRALPSYEPLFSSLGTLDLDRMQITQLDLASPVAVLYASLDGEWFYVVSEIAEGWLHADTIAFCKQDVIKDYKKWDRFAVILSPKADIYKNEDMTEFFDYVSMGTALPIAGIKGEIAEIRIPKAKSDKTLGFQKAYINLSDISVGYMQYTQRNVIQQAFKHLNSPYGWGGMNGEQDCSSFIRQIFACFGIKLPRNSTGQIESAGIFAGSFEKGEPEYLRSQRIIKNGMPGLTILYFPGHIMLYVGSEGPSPYIIHSIWGYGEETEKESKTYLINRVAITSMRIGESSKKGSLLQRTTLMKIVK